MSEVCSARVSRLASFGDVTADRVNLRTTRGDLAGDHRGVVSRCPGRSVDVPALSQLIAVLANMDENETFVSTVHTAVVETDSGGVGSVTYDRSSVDLALRAAGVADPPAPVEFDPTTAAFPPPLHSGYVDDPINASNGNMVHPEDDIEFPAIAAALNMSRTWNSLIAQRSGAFGAGWSSALDVRLVVEPGRVVATFADGSVVAYAESASGWAAAGIPHLRLWRDPSGASDAPDDEDGAGWVLQTDLFRRFLFDARGDLTGWCVGVARVEVRRDDTGRIVELFEALTGRTLRVEWTVDGLVERLTTDDGRSVVYQRDDDGVLLGARSDAGSISYVWDGTLLVSVVDADGVELFVNVYDDTGRVVEQTAPFGRVSTYRYEDTGLTVFSDAAGVVQAMRHDRLGNLTAVFDVDGSAMHLAYDDERRIVRVTERDGATVRYRYDADDLIERVDPDGLSQQWEWDHLHRLVADHDRTGATTRFEYDTAHMAPSRVIGPDGAVASQLLDERGLPTEIVDPDGVVTTMRWDRDGQLVATVDAFGAATVFDYDDHGLLRRLAPPSGAATVMEYDRGRLVRTERGEGVWEYRYTAAGRVCGGAEPGGVGWSATFGPHGALETFTDAAASTAAFGYDAIGNVTEVTAPDGAVYRHIYDEVGRMVAAVDATGATTGKSYDRRGRLIELTDPRGQTWRRSLDVLGRTMSSTAPDGAVTEWAYHPDGQVTSVTAPDGRVWRTEYDVMGRPVAEIDPAGGRSAIEYSAAGRVRSRTTPAGRREGFEYDAAGRLATVVGTDGVRRELSRDAAGRIAIVVYDGDSGTARQIGYRWDDDYRLVGVTATGPDGEKVSSISRDPGGRVVEQVDPTGVTTRFEWDQRGLLAEATDPAGLVTAYDYDVRGRLAAVHAPGDRSTTLGYGLDGQVDAITDAAGSVSRLRRDAAGAVTGLRHGDGSGWDRRLDAAGRELERVGTDGTVAGAYAYDPAGRLRSATVPDSGVTIEFLWDDCDRVEQVVGPHGTRLIERNADGWVTATVDPDGQRTEYQRDARGRVIGADGDRGGDGFGGPSDDDDRTRDRAGRLTIGADGTVFRYDHVGRIAEIAPVDQSSTTFTYNADGLVASERGPRGVRRFGYDRAGRVISVAVDGVIEGAGVTQVHYDSNGRRHREDRPDGSAVVYRWDVFDRLDSIERRDTDDVVVDEIPVRYDALGRATLVDDTAVGYHPLTGLPDTGPWTPGSHNPPGGVPAGEVWIVGVRVFDPATHQFLSTDPLLPVPGSHGAASGYTYAWQDPINWVDPTGMRPLSEEEFQGVMERAEQSKLGAAWEAIKEDPWGSLAMVGVTALGVGLCFVPGGQVVGAGILIGVATGAGVGIATGTFNPRMVALSGAVGAIPGGNTFRGAVTIGATTGAAETVGGSYLNGDGFPSWQQIAIGTGTGGALSGGGHRLFHDRAMTSQLQSHVNRSVSDFESGIVQMSPGQARAAARNPGLEPMFRGSVIDDAAKNRVLADPWLNVQATPRFQYGPDFHDGVGSRWWDMTTERQWPAHVDQYSDDYGRGTLLPTGR